jgi:hypothetical protein
MMLKYAFSKWRVGCLFVGLLAVAMASEAAGPPKGAPEVVYRLDQPARVSLLLSDAGGKVVRELLHAAPRPAGENRESWDGLDEQGQPASAGAYTWKLLASDGLKAEYLLSLGSTCVPAWKQMPGNHNGVTSVAVDGTGSVYLVAGCSEGPPQIVKQSLDGKTRSWDAAHVFDGWQGGVASAVLSNTLYSLQPAGIVIVVDGATGKRTARWELWWNKDDKGDPDSSKLVIDLAGRGDQLVMAYQKHDAIRWIDPVTGKVLDEAAVAAPQAVAVAADGRVFVLTSNTVVTLTRAAKTPVTVIGPGNLVSAYRLDVCPVTGDVLVLDRGEGNRIKRFSQTGEPTPNPSKEGNKKSIRPSQDGSKESTLPSTYHLIATYGRAGGRLQGPYEPNDFGTVLDLTADGAGGFFVCEGFEAPRRTARFDREGKLVSDWYGGQMYANHAVADPDDPTLVWVDSHFGTIIKAKVDYVARTWKVLATYAFGGMMDGFIPSTTHGGGRFVVRHSTVGWAVPRPALDDAKVVGEANVVSSGQGTARRTGEDPAPREPAQATYLCRDDDPIVLRVDEANRRLVPLVASDPILVHGWDATPKLVKQATYPTNDPAKPFPTPGWDAFGHRGWMWTDLNGDARPAVEEISFGKFWGWSGSRWYVDAQMNYVRYCVEMQQSNDVLQTMPLLEWTAAKSGAKGFAPSKESETGGRQPSEAPGGRQSLAAAVDGIGTNGAKGFAPSKEPLSAAIPIYAGWSATQPIPATMPDWLQATKGDYGARGRIGCVGIWPDGEGGWFGAFNNGNNGFGMGFMSAKVGANRVVRWDATGKLLWDVGRHSPDLGVRPGEARSFFRTAGVAHGCVAVTDIECYYNVKNLVYVWDRDGLWVGRLLENPDTNAAPAEAYTLCTENFGGSLIEITPAMKTPGLNAGDVIFFGSGQNDTRVYRITGWETMRRQTGTVEVPPEFAATLAAKAEREAKRPDLAHVGRVSVEKVDGDLKKWEKTTPLTIRLGDKDLAKLYLGWNPGGLYACFDVTTDRPWQSKSSVTEAFTGGAAVDVNIGPLTPSNRTTAVLGDARFVVAPIGQNGREVLVEFLPYCLPENQGQKKPVTFETSAQGKVSFERVGACPPAQVASRLKPDGSGYVVELQMPMRTPLKPAPGHRFKFDASVILADALDGKTSDARLPWHSRAPEDQLVTADQVMEATLRPQNWGEAVLE